MPTEAARLTSSPILLLLVLIEFSGFPGFSGIYGFCCFFGVSGTSGLSVILGCSVCFGFSSTLPFSAGVLSSTSLFCLELKLQDMTLCDSTNKPVEVEKTLATSEGKTYLRSIL